MTEIDDIKDTYSIGPVLGEGAYGLVRIAKHKQLKFQCAIKIVKKAFLKKQLALTDLMENELMALEHLNHTNMVKIHELLENEKNYYLVQEYVSDGTLKDLVEERNDEQEPLSEQEVNAIAQQLFATLNYMHKKKYVHRDLKTENIMMGNKERLEIKVADFGFAVKLREGEDEETLLGTPAYIAPEILKRVPYDEKVDIWSAGVILYELLSNESPFKGRNKNVLFQNIKTSDFNFDSRVWNKISAEAKDFVAMCLNKNPAQRYSAEKLLKHKWLNNAKENS